MPTAAAPPSPFSLAGRVALVTGASRGLGAAMARALARAGADVVLHASTTPPTDHAAALASECGVRTGCLVADLQRRDAADALVPGVLDEMGRLDVVVNNAGIIRRADAESYADADWDAVIEVNLSAMFRLCRA